MNRLRRGGLESRMRVALVRIPWGRGLVPSPRRQRRVYQRLGSAGVDAPLVAAESVVLSMTSRDSPVETNAVETKAVEELLALGSDKTRLTRALLPLGSQC
jgi:hypothetical protein